MARSGMVPVQVDGKVLVQVGDKALALDALALVLGGFPFQV